MDLPDWPTIVVTGQKGGVGKTMISTNLAHRLSQDNTVGILDADIDSPNLPEVMGVSKQMAIDSLQNFVPSEYSSTLKMFSMSLIHRHGRDHGFSKSGDQNESILNDALRYTSWGVLDFMLVDLPAGSSDEFRAIIKRLKNIVGLVVVTLPNTITDLRRVVDLAGRYRIPILGVVENMARVVCPNCQHMLPMYGIAADTRVHALCQELHLKYLGSLPYMPELHRNHGGSFQLPPEHSTVIDNILEEINDQWPVPKAASLPSDHQSDEATV